MTDQLTQVLNAIDAANSKDPRVDEGQPEALLYGQRMSEECARLFPNALETLQIAARGQHVERWVLLRKDYPEGRAGYLTWRKDLAAHHAKTVAGFMADAGYDAESIEETEKMLRKEGIKRNELVQSLEDVICFVFLKWYFAPFAAKHAEDKVQRIVEKTARKMSEAGRVRVLQEFELPETLAAAFR